MPTLAFCIFSKHGIKCRLIKTRPVRIDKEQFAVNGLPWKEVRKTLISTSANNEIWVEKSGHRRIVIGSGGAMIKEIGRTARKQLEVFLQERVFLELEVVVRRDWRRDKEALRELGYEP